MATPAVDWNGPIKFLLSASYSTFKKNDIPALVECITNGENEILNHDTKFEVFFSSLVGLSVHYICYNINSVEVYSVCMSEVTSACKVLIKFLLKRLQKHHDNCAISQKNIMALIKSLCKGTSLLPKSEVVMLTAQLKSADFPVPEKPQDTDGQEPSVAESKELSRPRLDTGLGIYTQMTAIFDDLPSPSGSLKAPSKLESSPEKLNSDGDKTIVHLAFPGEEVENVFTSRNILTLQQMNGGDILLDVCLELGSLKQYINGFHKALKQKGELPLASSIMDAMCVRSTLQTLVNDISIVCRVGSLPLIEPLTPSRLEKIVSITMACLYAATAVSTATSIINMATSAQMKGVACTKDEDLDIYAATIVQKTLMLYAGLSTAIKSSTRVPSQSLQNVQMLTSWCLLRGLHHLVTLSPSTIIEKGKDSTPKCSPGKAGAEIPGQAKVREGSRNTRSGSTSISTNSYTGFGMLPMALASQALECLQALMEDLQLENMAVIREPAAAVSTEGLPDIRLGGQYTAVQRILLLTESFDLTSLLIGLLSVSLKKAVSLRKPKLSKVSFSALASEHSSDSSSSSTSDSNTYYEDDFSSPDETSDEEDDDSEPILGQWFEETLSPGEGSTAASQKDSQNAVGEEEVEDDAEVSDNKNTDGLSSLDSPFLVGDKLDPEMFVALGGDILTFLIVHCLDSSQEEVQLYFRSSLTDQHMAIIAMVIRDIDRDFPKLDDNVPREKLSVALAKLTHILVANDILTQALQDTLLFHLGVGIHGDEPWPLRVYPRTLAVLAEVLLLRQQREREGKGIAGRIQTKEVVIGIWTRFVDMLVSAILAFDNNTKAFEDVNVEHMQLLLFLFHSLPLALRHQILTKVANSIIKVAQNFHEGPLNMLQDHVPLPLSRLILTMDYLLRYYYDPPAQLMEQLQHNLFTVYAKSSSKVPTGQKDKDTPSGTQFFPCKEVEDAYHKHMSAQEVKKKKVPTATLR